MAAHWPYYTLRDGALFDEGGRPAFTTPTYSVPAAPKFDSVTAAEDWLHTYDLRGNVRSDWCTPLGDRLGDADY
jgi:hypothetical protein